MGGAGGWETHEGDALLERALRVIPGASQTMSKSPSQWIRGVAPVFAARADGPFVWDVQGRRYYDLPMALGPIILGHAHPAVTAAISAQLTGGTVFTLPHPLEVDVAERIIRLVPGVEMVRFGKSGSDATSAAVRAARAITGRDHVLFSGYHGWQDWHIGATSRSAGVPTAVRSLTHGFAFNDVASLDSMLHESGDQVAAIIIEPSGAQEPESGFLEAIRERADACGALLVFDEILTGFRLAKGGAQERYGVRADLVCFAKALANGMPLSAVAGAARHMTVFEDEVFFSGTHGGEVLSLAAARATLDLLQDDAVHPHLWDLGTDLTDRINAAAQAHGMGDQVRARGAAPMSNVVVDEPTGAGEKRPAFSLFQQELAKRGVLFNGSNFICVEHSASHIDEIATAYDEGIAVLSRYWPNGLEEALEGPPVRRVFRPVLGSRAAAQELAGARPGADLT